MSALSSATHPALVPPGHGSRMPINPGRSRLTSSDSGPRAQHQLDTFIRAAVGPYQVTRNASQAHGTARIVVVQADAGARFVVKQHADPAAGRRELRAYRHWVPVLAGQAPQFCDADDELHALVLTFVPGDPRRADPTAQLEAGALLRRFHDSEPPQSRNRFVPRILEELTDALERGPHLFDAEETQFVQGSDPRLGGVAHAGVGAVPSGLRAPELADAAGSSRAAAHRLRRRSAARVVLRPGGCTSVNGAGLRISWTPSSPDTGGR